MLVSIDFCCNIYNENLSVNQGWVIFCGCANYLKIVILRGENGSLFNVVKVTTCWIRDINR